MVLRRVVYIKIRKLTENTVILGILSLIWLISRSGTKPSRIIYPCQKAAAAISYTTLFYPILAFSAVFSRKLVSKSVRMIKFSNRKSRLFSVFLLSVSILFSSFAIFISFLITNPREALRERTAPLERVASVSVVHIEGSEVEEALERALGYLGGVEKIVPEGSRVMIKPNIVQNQAPPDTSDPSIVKAVIDIVKKQNPSTIWIADGSGHDNTTENFRSLGFSSVAEQTGAKLVDLNYGEMVNVTVPGGGVVFDDFTFNCIAIEADVLISVACMKTHSQAVVTLGMKNLIGLAPGSIYGFPKAVLHDKAQEKGDNYMAGVIVDLCKTRKIDLVIIDGRIGMEGEGPHQGTPVQLDLIIVGTDPVATDSVASTIMGFDPEKVPSTKLGQQEGLGTNNLQEIEVKGEKLEDVFHMFKPATGHDSFQIFSSSYLSLYQAGPSLAYISVICWALTFVFLFFTKRKLLLRSNSNFSERIT